MNVAVPTIQHTGTHLIAKKFGPGYHWASMNEDTDRKAIFVGHISDGQLEFIKARLHDTPAVIPLRHPYRVAESWTRRGMDLTRLCRYFRLLVDEIDPFDPFYIAIDTPERDSQLEQVNQALNLSLPTTWPVRNSKQGTHTLALEDCIPDPRIRTLVNEISGFLSPYYRSTT